MIIRFLSIHGYHFFLALGAVAMLVIMLVRRKQYALSAVKASVYTLLLLATGIAGAKLLYFFECGMESFSGMSFFGAVYLVLLVMPVIGLAFKMKPLDSLDACAPCVAAIIGFQRFGCFCAGCCGGIPMGSTGLRWPTQLMDGFGDMMILCLMFAMERKGIGKGRYYPFFLIFYGIMRFFIEFVRETPKDWMYLSHGQWFCIIGILIAGFMLVGEKNGKDE